MKKGLYFGVLAFSFFLTCSCANTFSDNKTKDITTTNVQSEFETVEMKISYLYSEVGYDQVEVLLDDDNQEYYKTQWVLVDRIYRYYLDNSFLLYISPYTFFADGDIVRLTYKKGYEFKKSIYSWDLESVERIKSANIIKIDEELIIRNDDGTIKDINVNYKKQDLIVHDTSISNCIEFKDYSYSNDIYMSVSTDSNGEEYCVFYSFNPEEV